MWFGERGTRTRRRPSWHFLSITHFPGLENAPPYKSQRRPSLAESVSLWRGTMGGNESDWISEFISKSKQRNPAHNIRILDAKGSDVMEKNWFSISQLADWKRGHWEQLNLIKLHVKGSSFGIAAFADHWGARKGGCPSSGADRWRGKMMERESMRMRERGLFVVRCVGEHDFSHHNRGHQLK